MVLHISPLHRNISVDMSGEIWSRADNLLPQCPRKKLKPNCKLVKPERVDHYSTLIFTSACSISECVTFSAQSILDPVRRSTRLEQACISTKLVQRHATPTSHFLLVFIAASYTQKTASTLENEIREKEVRHSVRCAGSCHSRRSVRGKASIAKADSICHGSHHR
jgi:hypothetical protein